MRETTNIFIPIPKTRNTKVKVEVSGDDLTNRVKESSWVYPVTDGVGTFKLVLSNAHGQISGLYNPGDIVKFYADNADASTLQFWGRIDYIKENISKSGQFLEIEGRHRCFLLTEYLVCYSASSTTTSEILKAIIDKLPSGYGFTYEDVSTTTDLMDVEWNYKPFWECVVELCNFSGFDCYVDNDLDFHYFEENSIANEDDAIVEGDNLIDSKNWGVNNYYEKTRVIAMGQSADGLPIVYTAISEDEGAEIREVFIKDTSANTEQSVQDLAEAKLAEITNRTPQANVKSFGLETVKPGDNIWFLIPRQEVHGQYKLAQITHKFGAAVGGWRTECLVEQEEEGISKIIQNINQKSDRSIEADNINKLDYSWNFEFDSDSGTHSTTEITEGVLKATAATGTWISDGMDIDNNATLCELRVKGETIPGTVFYVSIDNGITWQSLSLKTLKTLSPPGKNLKIKVELNSASTQIYSVVLLYS